MSFAADVRRRQARFGGLDVNYWESGSGLPVILLHGGLATADMSWTNAMPLLAAEHRVFAPDSRGHGGTNNPGSSLGYDQLADDLAGFIRELGLEKPMVIGHSDGGQTALEFGLRHPGIAGALVLSGTMSQPTPDYINGLHQWGFTGPGTIDVDLIAAEFGADHEPTRLAHEHSGKPEQWPAFLSQISQLWLTLPSYAEEQLATIADPTLVITGDRDELADTAQAMRLYGCIPGAELAIVPNAGHGAADEPLFWQIVMHFISRHGLYTPGLP